MQKIGIGLKTSYQSSSCLNPKLKHINGLLRA